MAGASPVDAVSGERPLVRLLGPAGTGTGGVRRSVRGVSRSVHGVRWSARGVRRSARGVRRSTSGLETRGGSGAVGVRWNAG